MIYRKRKKGYVYTIEMLIAVSMILVAIVITFREAPKEQAIEVTMLKRYAWESLEYLNYNNTLREPVAADDETVIENELKGIRKAVDKSWVRLLLHGMVHGGGFVVGTVLAIAFAGWILSLFGVIPGFGDIAKTLKDILEARSGF